MILINLPRFLLYILLGFLSYYNQLPWWIAPAFMLYDFRWYLPIGFPGAKKKVMDEMQRRLGMVTPIDPKGWN
jgi:hypothetical protein